MKDKTLKLLVVLTLTTTGLFAQKQRFFRQIAYNHVSPHVEIRGIHELSKDAAQGESYYIFSYDQEGRLIQIINNHYATERRHPLTTIGAYRTEVSYTDNKETWIYFDKNGNRVENDRRVFKEEFLSDKKGFKYQLNFYDLDDAPTESMWKIARYTWKKERNLVVEQRFGLDSTKVNVSPYFDFGTTGIAYSKNGFPKAHHNLDEQMKKTDNSEGLASYKDEYDENGNHVKWSYYNQSGQLVKNQWGYAYAVKEYDAKGNILGWKTFDEEGSLIQDRPMVSNANIKLASSPTKEDSLEVNRISRGYLEALQELDSIKMKRVMHPQLAKRTIGFDWKEKRENIRETSYDQMIGFSKSWNKSGNKFPYNPTNKPTILDIYDRIATVKLVSDNWVEYLHLIKENGEWKIINLLWSHKNVNAYSHHSK